MPSDEYLKAVTIGNVEELKEKVTLCEYNNMWAELFQKEQDKIDKALKGNFVSIEHVGSTSVPGFRNRLRTHEKDREQYASVKRNLAEKSWKYMQNYADAKSEIVAEIFQHMKDNIV